MRKTDILCFGAILTVIILVISTFVYFWWEEREKRLEQEEKAKKKVKLVVEKGDKITVDYTGRFIDGRVFDTSIEEIGKNESIPKSITFDPDKSYKPLTFTVGSGEMIEGFDEGVVGMRVGETRTITVPPHKGYGSPDPALIKSIRLTEALPLYEYMSKSDFESKYPGEVLEVGVTTEHHFWGWHVVIEEVTGDNVTLRHDPEWGMEVEVLPWRTVVVSISSEQARIVVEHKPTEEVFQVAIDPGLLAEYNNTFAEFSEKGIVKSIEDEIVIDFNKEVVGKTLIFEVTVISIE
jgi:FKBP-type peptidyl-prolyl cis-trans isomerase 2